MKNNLSIISNEIFINKAENSNCENFNRKYYPLLQELILISGEYNQNFTKYVLGMLIDCDHITTVLQ